GHPVGHVRAGERAVRGTGRRVHVPYPGCLVRYKGDRAVCKHLPELAGLQVELPQAAAHALPLLVEVDAVGGEVQDMPGTARHHVAALLAGRHGDELDRGGEWHHVGVSRTVGRDGFAAYWQPAPLRGVVIQGRRTRECRRRGRSVKIILTPHET